jgi:hypothetical protein
MKRTQPQPLERLGLTLLRAGRKVGLLTAGSSMGAYLLPVQWQNETGITLLQS